MACSKKLLAAKHDKTRPATKCHGTMQSHIIEPLRVEPEPIRTEPDLTDRIRSARHEPPSGAGGAARESGVAGEEKGLATPVAAPFLSGQPPPTTCFV